MVRIFIVIVIVGNVLFANVGIIKKIEGKVNIKRKGKIVIAKKGSFLENGDIVITKDKSSVGITFDDGSRLALGEKAIFAIYKYIVKPDKNKYEIDLELKKGKIMFSSGKIGKLSPKSFKLRIPEGIVGIRGTKFIVEVK